MKAPLDAENLNVRTTQPGEVVLEPSYVQYLRENGYTIEGVVNPMMVYTNSERAHLVVQVETYQYPRDDDRLDVAEDRITIPVCDCGDYTYRKAVDVGEADHLEPDKMGVCKHIEEVESDIRCDGCGAAFSTKGGLSRHKTRGHKPHMDSKRLGELYWLKGMTLREVAKELETDSGTVSRWMDKLGIPKRSQVKSSGGYEFSKKELETLYHKQDKTVTEIAEQFGVHNSTVSRQMQKHGVPTNSVSTSRSWGKADYWDYGENWQEKRQEAKKRDSYQCVICGLSKDQHNEKHGEDLHVHHIMPRRYFVNGDSVDGSKANRLNNLITVCQKCHSKWEGVPLRPQSSRGGDDV